MQAIINENFNQVINVNFMITNLTRKQLSIINKFLHTIKFPGYLLMFPGLKATELLSVSTGVKQGDPSRWVVSYNMESLTLDHSEAKKKKICVSDRPTDPKNLLPTLTFFMPKKIIDRQNLEIHFRFRLQQQTLDCCDIDAF